MIQRRIAFGAHQLHRNGDPETSRLAAFDLVASGTFGRMERLALNVIEKNPGRTAKELETIAGVEAGQIRKRLANLKRQGKIKSCEARRCNISGRKAQTWSLAPAAV
jgi:predicted HTH transcriptional regulator